jgi:lipid-binding SYLF domain-containing protein
MRRFLLTGGVILLAAVPALAALSSAEARRISDAATVLTEIHATPDKDIPQEMWDKASCVMVVPGMKKAAFIVGGEYGKGLLSCKRNGSWSAPIFMRIEKGSWGLQIGAQSIDLVLLVMNDKGIDKLLGNKVSLGAEMSVAAGPVGRDARAATDGQLQAEILSYSRTQGLFAGINLSGGVIRGDEDDNRDLYGRTITPRAVVVEGSVATPKEAEGFVKALRRGM